jgi:cobalt/nickel transport system permease protein
MPFAAYYIYNIVSGNSDINSTRRIIAAALAGYISLTLAAGVTGFEFGLQPLLHQDASGMPLYMPYGLSVAVPAMLLEHLLFFGFVEAIVTAVIFGYIVKTDPSLLGYRDASASR